MPRLMNEAESPKATVPPGPSMDGGRFRKPGLYLLHVTSITYCMNDLPHCMLSDRGDCLNLDVTGWTRHAVTHRIFTWKNMNLPWKAWKFGRDERFHSHLSHNFIRYNRNRTYRCLYLSLGESYSSERHYRRIERVYQTHMITSCCLLLFCRVANFPC